MWVGAIRARNHFTSSALIGGKGGANGPRSLLYTTLEGPMEGVSECKMDVNVYVDSFLHGIEWIMFHGTWIIFINHLLGPGKLYAKPGGHGTLNARKHWFILI